MPINLLVDNCIFIQIISKTEFSPTLRQLQFLVEQKHVTLLVPEILITEWANHRESLKNDIQTAFRDDRNQVKFRKILKDPSAEFLEEKIEEAIQSLYAQIEVIDTLLSIQGIKISASNELHALIRDQKAKRKAPFRKPHKDNYNDAELIFTTLNYLSDHNSAELYFISENKAEFAYGDPPILHPEISERFSPLKINYFLNLKDVFSAFDRIGIPRYEKKKEKEYGKVKTTIIIDKTKPVLNQIAEYLEKRFRLLTFIPKKLFTEHYPFIIADTFNYYHRPFTIITDNIEVYNFLTKVKIIEGIVNSEDPSLITSKEDEIKIIGIFQTLRQNNIDKVAFKDKDEVPIVCSLLPIKCNCSLCQYNRMDWSDLIDGKCSERADLDNSFEGKLRDSYVQYKVGSYYKAALKLQELLIGDPDRRDILRYIAYFNLKHLAPILTNYYWDNSEVRELGDRLSQIDLDDIYKECVQFEDREILDWLHKNSFISETLSRMHKKVNQITDHFYGQNTGYNNNTFSLAEHYGSADAFLFKNSIIYDYYVEFESLTTLFIQGLVASYGCNALMSGKLNSLNDNNLKKLLFAGNADIIQKYLVRYKSKNIRYVNDAESNASIIAVITSIVENYKNIEKSANRNQQTLSLQYFWDFYTELINNALTILAMIDLDDQIFNSMLGKFLEFLENDNKLILFRILKNLRFLFNRKHKSFANEMLHKFYLVSLKKKEFHSDRFFEILAGIINDRQTKMSVSETDFQHVRDNFLINSYEGQMVNVWFGIGYIFSTLDSEKQKQEISSHVKKSLKENFNSGKYYLACMCEMMQPDATFNKLYEADIAAVIQLGPRERLFNTKLNYTDSRIDNYLNFCLKYSLGFPNTIKDIISCMGTYYQWLFDIEGFDYTKFNKDWLYYHFTFYFKQEFRKCKELKNHLLNLIKLDTETELERMFVLIFCLND